MFYTILKTPNYVQYIVKFEKYIKFGEKRIKKKLQLKSYQFTFSSIHARIYLHSSIFLIGIFHI